MKFYLYDDQGYFQKIVEANSDAQPQNSTSVSFLTMRLNTLPKWNGSAWVESGIAPKTVNASSDNQDQKLLMQQSQQIAMLQSLVMLQNQASVKLQAANQQQTDQIKQLQQMLMTANQQQAVDKSKEANAQ